MLIDLLIQHPEALGTIVRRTPSWVWGLLAGLLALGASQLRDRTASLVRISVMPVAMAGFATWGVVSAFGSSPVFGEVLATWLGTLAGVTALVAPGRTAATFDPVRREYRIPGSVVPLLLIAGIFLVKWGVGVELAMRPQAARDAGFALTLAATYGAFNGLFIGRAARLWRLAIQRPLATPAAA